MKAICNKCLTVVYVYTSYHIRVYTSKTLNVCYFFFNRTGKKFYCNKCKTTVIGYNEYQSHREAHLRIRNSTEEPVAGPSHYESAFPDMSTVNEQTGGGEDSYRIECTGTRKFARSAATETTYKVKLNDQWQGRRLTDLKSQLHDLFKNLLTRAREGINDNDLMRVVIKHDALNHAIVVPLMMAGEMNVEKILDKLENVLQSEENLTVDDSFQGQ